MKNSTDEKRYCKKCREYTDHTLIAFNGHLPTSHSNAHRNHIVYDFVCRVCAENEWNRTQTVSQKEDFANSVNP